MGLRDPVREKLLEIAGPMGLKTSKG